MAYDSFDVVVCVKSVPGVDFPKFATPGSACFDIAAHLPDGSVEIPPGEHAFIPTGLFFYFPKEWECQIRPRSGLSNKKCLLIPNSPGTIDSDYSGEIKVGLLNLSKDTVTISHKERIAQGKMERVWNVGFTSISEDEFKAVHGLSLRGAGGFGSTGA